MSIIEKIQKKTQEEKLRIIWIAAVIAVVLLTSLWAITSRVSKDSAKDTTLFKTIGQGVKDIRDNYHK